MGTNYLKFVTITLAVLKGIKATQAKISYELSWKVKSDHSKKKKVQDSPQKHGKSSAESSFSVNCQGVIIPG